MAVINPDTAWMALSVLWSLNGPLESSILRVHAGPAYAKLKAVVVGAAYLCSPVAFDWQLFSHPLMWVMLIVSVVNTPLNVYIIKYANPAVQLPLAQVVSQLLRMIWWAIILKRPLSLKQYFGVCCAAVGTVCLT